MYGWMDHSGPLPLHSVIHLIERRRTTVCALAHGGWRTVKATVTISTRFPLRNSYHYTFL